MDDEVMTDDEQDYLADNGTLSIELNDADIATSSGVSEGFLSHSAKTANMLPESLNPNMAEEGSTGMNPFSISHDDIGDAENNAGNSKMAYQSSMNNNVDSGQSVSQNGAGREEKIFPQGKTLPKVSNEKGEKEKRRGSREEPEDGEILEDGEIASEEDDLFFGKRPRDDDECSEKSASSPEELEIKSEASEVEVEKVEKVEVEKPEPSRREHRKRKRDKRDKRRKKNEAKRKRKRLDYVDHDQVNDEYKWNLSSKNKSPSGLYDSPSEKPSSPYRNSPGAYGNLYESPPGLYDSPSDDDDDEEGSGPKLVNLIGDNFMDLAVAATEKEDIFKPREKKRGGKKKRSHHHHSSKKKPLLETPRQRTMCKFFKEGKCSKAEDCPYSHDFKPSKKTDICKFYLNSICTKGDNCLFLHGEYPCKFYHTGAQCYQGEKCKFSHEPLNEETKILLEKILEHRDEDSSDDDSSREDGSNGKKIPSLFDIKVFPPGQSPKKSAGPSGSQNGRPGFYKDSLSSSPSGNSSCSMPPSGSGMGGLGQLRPNVGSPGHPSFLGSRQAPSDCPSQQQSPPQHGCSPPHPQPSCPPGINYLDNDNTSQSQDNLHHPIYHPMYYHHHHGMLPDERHNLEGEKIEERKPVPIEIPSHLPPRQKELFLRIHQQQQLLNTAEKADLKNDVKVDDDNWYSSDEDEDGKPKLADILKNLNKQPPKPPPSNKQGACAQGANSALNIMQMINAIRSPPNSASGGPPQAVSGGGMTTTNISAPNSSSSTGSSASSSGTSRRDPRRQAQKGNVSVEPKAMSSSSTKKADPRLLSGKATTSVPPETVPPPRLPSPPIAVINAIPSVELPYQLFEVSTSKLPLSATVDVFDPRFKNDPRVQKFLSNPPECLKQKAGSLQTDKMLKSLGVSNPNRIEDLSNAVPPPPPPPPPPTLPPLPPAAGLPPVLLRPHDPRLLRAVSHNPRSMGKKSDDQDSQEILSKSLDPRRPMRGGNEPKSMEPRFSRQQSNPLPAGSLRTPDPRLLRQQDAKNSSGRQSADPRAGRQQSPVREPTLPTLLLPPLPNANIQSGNSVNPRGPRTPMDQQKFGPRGSIPSSHRHNNPRSMRPENQNKNIDQNESQNTDSAHPKMDHRNDPRFRRKPAADGNNSQLPPPIRKFIGQRKGSMEYSSPLGVEMDKPEQSSGYNSYNRPPNANRQMGIGNKPRTSGMDNAPPNLPPGNPPLPPPPPPLPPPMCSELLQQSDPREMVGGHSELSGLPPGFPPPLPQNLPYQPMPPSDQPKLKDLFKTIDPTASPFC